MKIFIIHARWSEKKEKREQNKSSTFIYNALSQEQKKAKIGKLLISECDKVIIHKSRGEVSLLEQSTIEYVF